MLALAGGHSRRHDKTGKNSTQKGTVAEPVPIPRRTGQFLSLFVGLRGIILLSVTPARLLLAAAFRGKSAFLLMGRLIAAGLIADGPRFWRGRYVVTGLAGTFGHAYGS